MLKWFKTLLNNNHKNFSEEQKEKIEVFKNQILQKINSPKKHVSSSYKKDVSKKVSLNFVSKEEITDTNEIKNSFLSSYCFEKLSLKQEIVTRLSDLNFISPTEVQEKVIPLALEGENILCSSETGSGKTLAFVLPMIQQLIEQKISQGLIVVPTREIAIQIKSLLESVLKEFSFKSVLLIGGVNIKEQILVLKDYPKIIVATPGRLLDVLNTGLLWLKYTGFVVLDEADRMLDMGFEKDLLRIYQELPGDQQTLFFTATLVKGVESLVSRYTKNYQKVIIGQRLATGKNIKHGLIKVDQRNKTKILKNIFSLEQEKIIVFFNTIKAAQRCYAFFKNLGFKKMEVIHSGRTQEKREEIILKFKSNKISILLGTDLAARGLDIVNVSLVINYDIPRYSEEYIHRIGRTGRAGKSGRAYSFFTPQDRKNVQGIESIIGKKLQFLSFR